MTFPVVHDLLYKDFFKYFFTHNFHLIKYFSLCHNYEIAMELELSIHMTFLGLEITLLQLDQRICSCFSLF